MKNLPKTIFFQIGETAHPEDDFTEIDEEQFTWSTKRVWQSDIEYFRKKILPAEEVPEFQQSIDNMPQWSKDRVDSTLILQELLPMVRQFVHAQSRLIDDKYSEGDEAVKKSLWKDLHEKGDAVFNFMDDHGLMHAILNKPE